MRTDATAWYPVREFHVKHAPVVLRILGEDVIGWAIFTPSGEPRWRVGSLRSYTKLPRGACVDAWRPINGQEWPHPLPEPIKLLTPPDWQSAPPARAPVVDDGDEWWVSPTFYLGRAGEPPQTVRECEARILRFICTREAIEAERQRVEACWPPGLVKAAREVEQMLRDAHTGRLSFLRDEDYADFNDEQRPSLRARPARWRPTPRDVSEYEAGRVPAWMPQGGRRLFTWRAARPAYSFEQIADRLRAPVETVREDYEYQCERAFERAQG